MLHKASTLFTCLFIMGCAIAQDSTVAKPKEPKKAKEPLHLFRFGGPHSAKKASIYAAVLPGLGQIYNRKYWKVPLVYATFGAATYFMFDQRKKMRDMNAQFRVAYKTNPDTSLDGNDLAQRDTYRRYRDFGILAMAGIYVLQIVDATVDAHFYKFDIDQSLEAQLNPSPARFFQLTFHF